MQGPGTNFPAGWKGCIQDHLVRSGWDVSDVKSHSLPEELGKFKSQILGKKLKQETKHQEGWKLAEHMKHRWIWHMTCSYYWYDLKGRIYCTLAVKKTRHLTNKRERCTQNTRTLSKPKKNISEYQVMRLSELKHWVKKAAIQPQAMGKDECMNVCRSQQERRPLSMTTSHRKDHSNVILWPGSFWTHLSNKEATPIEPVSWTNFLGWLSLSISLSCYSLNDQKPGLL